MLKDLIEVSKWIHQKGWSPATGGNFSVRVDANSAYVSASGVDKSNMSENDFVLAQLDGSFEGDKKPSYESKIHLKIYEMVPEIGCVLHTHSTNSTALSIYEKSDELSFNGMEMQKSISGFSSHLDNFCLPLIHNDQDIDKIANATIPNIWSYTTLSYGFILRGHGLYVWGKDVAEAKRHLEGIEFLLESKYKLYLLEKK